MISPKLDIAAALIISDVKDTPGELKISLEHDANNVKDTDKHQGIVFGVKPDRPLSFSVKGITIKCKDEVKLLSV